MKKRKFLPSKTWVNIVCALVVVIVIALVYILGIRSVVEQSVVFNVTRGASVSDVAEH